jgi:hypothetical protein
VKDHQFILVREQKYNSTSFKGNKLIWYILSQCKACGIYKTRYYSNRLHKPDETYYFILNAPTTCELSCGEVILKSIL